ncbi:allantoate amidohydrolase [Ornithinibacter aureus]|uniref:Allantoate amidohydrolase n=1 Tax=Ornithinibacter aureus TaxID=622664 RepID=A0ABP8KA98_9MICO|nr:allantoate amidohydrolase [Ornithinibacter aureus]KAF0834202.1 N-carbamoyl-L-amino-acid hydrolase [Ornithinibacter aureus]
MSSPGGAVGPPSPAVSGFRRLWQDLHDIGRSADTGGYNRFAWTREDHDLREWFTGQCEQRGLDVTTDRMGNQWAWWGDPDAAVAAGDPGVVIGSHLDSVPDGGAFDGPLGVVGALAAIDHLRAIGFTPTRPIGAVNFVDEEGARFGVACAGSRVITGVLGGDRARGLTDRDGTSMAEAMRAAGRDPAHVGRDDETLARIGTFVELHVEQGRALVDLGHAVGVGSDIWPHGRWRVDLPGEANHAGTTRLEDREDAMLGLAAMIIAARRAATDHGCVATVGKVNIVPGGVNAIASGATGWLDARGADADAVRRVVADVGAVVADFDGLVTQESWTPTTMFDPALAQQMAARLGGVPVIGTGAGHDAGILANDGIRTAMLFVRNPTGVSHSPDEWASADDCVAGVLALADVVSDLAGADAARGGERDEQAEGPAA